MKSSKRASAAKGSLPAPAKPARRKPAKQSAAPAANRAAPVRAPVPAPGSGSGSATGSESATGAVRVIVTLDDACNASDVCDATIAASEKAGLHVEQRLPTIGIVAGSIAPGHLDRLRKVKHVVAVERDEQRHAI